MTQRLLRRPHRGKDRAALPSDPDAVTETSDTRAEPEPEQRDDLDTDEGAETPDTHSDAEPDEGAPSADTARGGFGGIRWTRVMAYGVLPALALIVAMAAGYLKWQDTSRRDAQLAAAESVRVATDSTVAMLSYRPDTVERDLGAAQGRMTGKFKDSYVELIRDVVIPGSKQRQISATATVPAAASVSVSANHAVVLLFVDQTIVEGGDPPTGTASRVRVTLEKTDGQWLISGFDPV